MPSNITVGSPVSVNTLTGLIRMNDRNLTDWSVSDILAPTQFQNALPWFKASNGTQHKWTVETALPGSAFRLLNNGVANAAGQEKTVTANLSIIDASYDDVDVMLASEAKGGRDAYLMKRGMRSLNSGIVRAEFSLIRGTDYDAAGPDGLQQLVSVYNLGFNAGGNGGTRVYMLITGESDVCGILGNDGRFEIPPPFMSRKVTNPETGAAFTAWAQNITGYMCLQVGGKYSAAVGYNFSGADAAKSVTDKNLAEIYSLFPSDRAPRVNLILMSRIGLKQLQQSRIATTPTGAYVEYPTSWNGAGRLIPICVSDAVNDEESTVTTTTTTTTTSSTTTTTTAAH